MHEKKQCQPAERSDVDQDTPEKCGEYCSADGKEMFFYFLGMCFCVTDHENCQLSDTPYYNIYKIKKKQGNSLYREHYS